MNKFFECELNLPPFDVNDDPHKVQAALFSHPSYYRFVFQFIHQQISFFIYVDDLKIW